MPDIYGVKTLSEIRSDVWRNVGAIRANTFDPTTGTETSADGYDYSELYPKNEIDRFINESLTAHYLDLIANSAESFADESLIDIVKDQVEYRLPGDVAQLRGLWWKDTSTTLTLVPPSERIFMHEEDEGSDPLPEIVNGAPTYRRQLNFIVLNSIPDEDNTGGILARYIKWINPLLTDDAKIETEFARVLQEVVAVDASLKALERKSKVASPELQRDLENWEIRLASVVRNSTNPPFINLVGRHPFRKSDRIW